MVGHSERWNAAEGFFELRKLAIDRTNSVQISPDVCHDMLLLKEDNTVRSHGDTCRSTQIPNDYGRVGPSISIVSFTQYIATSGHTPLPVWDGDAILGSAGLIQ